jgi:hypothetical protein
MKKIFVVSIYLMIASFTSAQQTVDVLYLLNGTIIRGKIIDNTPDRVKIEACCGSVFSFSQSEIEKSVQENYPANQKGYIHKGYINFTSMGLLVGSTVNAKVAPFSALMEHNFLFNKYFAAGGVFGVELLNETVCPVAVNIKAFLPLRAHNLYIGVSGGYSISTEKPDTYGLKDANGGYLFNTEIGYLKTISENSGFFFAIGYRYNELNYKMEDWWWDGADRKMFFNRISIRTGISIY